MTELVYECDREKLGSELAVRFRPLARDAETDAWLEQWTSRPNSWMSTKLGEWLSSFISSYEVHGLLSAYPMFLLSSAAWGELLDGQRVGSLLDVGAGAGYVTEGARPFCDELLCTETSASLRKQLAERGLTVSELDLTRASLARSFDVVSALNVLDRTAYPLTLLRSLRAHMRPAGRLLLSIPLPVSGHVHVKGGTVAQSERLPSLAADWETAARELSERLLAPAGLEVVRLARVPYLSRGDSHAPLYVLDAAVWVCRQTAPIAGFDR